jgi:hypothetical protein
MKVSSSSPLFMACATITSLQLIFLHSSTAFHLSSPPVISRHHASSFSKASLLLLRVYTPEQEQDDKKREEAAAAAAAAAVSDQVLSSLSEKLNKKTEETTTTKKVEKKKKDNNAMAFLKSRGKVGGAANKNFVNAVGSDEGSTGRQPVAQRKGAADGGAAAAAAAPKKTLQAYEECTTSGIIDDLSESFPLTSSGTEWRGISDRVLGGMSDGCIKRETIYGKAANVLTGHVSLKNNGGFIQMVTDLPLDPVKAYVDASEYDGIELTVLCRHEPLQFNVHVRTPGTLQQQSYRHTVELEESDTWETIKMPFSDFQLVFGGSGKADNNLPTRMDYSGLRRIGIVAIGEEMDVDLAVGDVRFYCVI